MRKDSVVDSGFRCHFICSKTISHMDNTMSSSLYRFLLDTVKEYGRIKEGFQILISSGTVGDSRTAFHCPWGGLDTAGDAIGNRSRTGSTVLDFVIRCLIVILTSTGDEPLLSITIVIPVGIWLYLTPCLFTWICTEI